MNAKALTIASLDVGKVLIANAMNDMIFTITRSIMANRPFRIELSETSPNFQALLKIDPLPYRFTSQSGKQLCEFRGFAGLENGRKKPWLLMVETPFKGSG